MTNIRNFSIIAHIDHGKSTLADRMLEITGTIPARKMRAQVLDQMDLERERGITIKMQPVRMLWKPQHADRRIDADSTQTNAEADTTEFLYKDLTYKIRGILFQVRKNLGLGHKESVYHNALEIEFRKAGISFESKKNISIQYDGKSIGLYQPDFVIENKILIELKALPEIGKPQIEQLWAYLKGCDYTLALLANYGSRDLEIKRVVYDTARDSSALSASGLRESAGSVNQIESSVLNLIDTPGHIDFSYEVSRALTAVEGVLLLVDATQGIQAQTLATLSMARTAGCVIIPVVSKIDASAARIPEVRAEVAQVVGVPEEDVFLVSGKTGEGVSDLLAGITRRIPPPSGGADSPGTSTSLSTGGRALVFDFSYSEHRGIIAYVRVTDGSIRAKDVMVFSAAGKRMTASEVGWFAPEMKQTEILRAGEIGYIVTGIKEPGVALVGDTILAGGARLPALPGYQTPRPVVWASLYPENQNDFPALKQALSRLHLSDAALSFEEDGSAILGKGFRCGFLGMLHMEIVAERLKRESGCHPILTAPSITYEVTDEKGIVSDIISPVQFPEDNNSMLVREQWVKVSIIMPPSHLSPVHQLLYEHEAVMGETHLFGDGRIALSAEMPLRELMRGFFDRLKSVSSGFASLSYEFADWRPAEVCRLDILIAEELMPAFSRIVSSRRVEEEARSSVERLSEVLPRQLFVLKIQAKAKGRIIASRTLSAMRKDVTGYLYGGDVTRKKKLLEKQKKGKERRGEHARVNIPPDIFLKMMKTDG